jgi:hypothetical protein
MDVRINRRSRCDRGWRSREKRIRGGQLAQSVGKGLDSIGHGIAFFRDPARLSIGEGSTLILPSSASNKRRRFAPI